VGYEGLKVGIEDGLIEGFAVGNLDGRTVGDIEGRADGSLDGVQTGIRVEGKSVISNVGETVGEVGEVEGI